MRLIDADKLRKPIYAEDDNCTGDGMTYDEMDAYNDGIDKVWKRIESAHTIDAVPVVRCGECRYAHLTTDGKLVKYCDNWCDENRIARELYLPTDFYCAYAKDKSEI